MSEQDTKTDDSTSDADENQTADTDTNDNADASQTADDDGLGDAGKKAIDRMKVEKKQAIADAKAATARADAAEAALANKDKPADEVALDAARAEATKAATEAANLKLAKSALRLAAKGVLADPADAALYIDATQFEVDDEGEVDSDAVNEAIAELLTRKSHLAAPKANRFDGDADQGAKGKDATPPQWTEADLDKATDDETTAAKAAGLLDNLLGIKRT